MCGIMNKQLEIMLNKVTVREIKALFTRFSWSVSGKQRKIFVMF